MNRPKITVKAKHSFYHLLYSELNNDMIKPNWEQYDINLYIDIPTFDYYNDELNDLKLSKFNKKFKLNKLKWSIWKSMTNNIDTFWFNLFNMIIANKQTKKDEKKFVINLSFHSSGSIRYVQTIKFLIEKIYHLIHENDDFPKLDTLIDLKINIEVSKLSLFWFERFIEPGIFSRINFIKNFNHDKDDSIEKSPFKEYFTKLNSKFSNNIINCTTNKFDTIIIITNSTGIKALLTILEDKPLTHFMDQNSINEFYSCSIINSGKNKDKVKVANNAETCGKDTNCLETTNLKRESSSLLNFQSSLLTSNKDKSVRVRSLSLNRKVPHTNNTNTPSLINRSCFTSSKEINDFLITGLPSKTQIISKHDQPLNFISRTKDIMDLIDQEDLNQKAKLLQRKKSYSNKSATDNDNHNKIDSIEKITSHTDTVNCEDDDNNDDEEIDEDDEVLLSSSSNSSSDDEGISFFVPSLLSRSSSRTNMTNMNTDYDNSQRRGRFRSLSLMNPAETKPFALNDKYSKTPGNNNNNELYSNKQNENLTNNINNNTIISNSDKIIKTFSNSLNDEDSNQDSNTNTSIPATTQSFSNIYIHDGDFNEFGNIKYSKHKNKSNINFNTNSNNSTSNLNNNNNNNKIHGLIPPEFYSRISPPLQATAKEIINNNSKNFTPYSSNNSSSQNMNTPKRIASDHMIIDNNLTSPSNAKIFEKNLINESFELNRIKNNTHSHFIKQQEDNIFNRLINKRQNRLLHNDLLNFNSLQNNYSARYRDLYDEDQMLGVFHEEDEDTFLEGSNDEKHEQSERNENESESITPYKKISSQGSVTDTTTSILNTSDISKNSSIPEFTVKHLNLQLYDEPTHPEKEITDTDERDDNKTTTKQEDESVKFKRIASFNLYGPSDGNDTWVLGGNV